MGNKIVILLVSAVFFCGCDSKEKSSPAKTSETDLSEKQQKSEKEGGKKMAVKITSSAFADGQMIPSKYTCDGRDVSPPLQWDGVPETAQSIALICDDPDAPMGTWVHWVLFNLPADTTKLAEAMGPDETLANGAKQGTSDFGRIGYGGPCPPSGTHRYFFKIYALDSMLDLLAGASKRQLVDAMAGHIIGESRLMGKYKRR